MFPYYPTIEMEQWNGVCEDTPVLTALLEQGFTTPTEIQKRAVPEALRGHDVIGAAETVRKCYTTFEYYLYLGFRKDTCFWPANNSPSTTATERCDLTY